MLFDENVEPGWAGELRTFRNWSQVGLKRLGLMSGLPTSEFIEMLRSRGPFCATDGRRALVNLQAVVDVCRQLAAEHIGGVCVFHAGRPVLDIIDPALAIGLRVRRAGVVDSKPSLSSAYSSQARDNCLTLLPQVVAWALILARDSAGNNRLARMAMMAMTTKSSIRVKPRSIAPGWLFMRRDSDTAAAALPAAFTIDGKAYEEKLSRTL